MSPVESLVEQLRRRAQLNPPATKTELDRLQDLLGDALPDDVVTFYSLANGMPDLAYDDHEVSFWSIERMHTERTKWHDDRFGFAYFFINSWRFLFLPSERGIIVATENVEPGSPLDTIGTFTEFAALYLARPSQLRIL